MVRVFVVDDAPFIRKAIHRVLSWDPEIEVVGHASRGEEALEKIPACRPDLVTLDIDLPGMNGLDTLAELQRSLPRLPVIMMSALTQEGADVTLNALSSGAVDFIDKTRLNMMDFRQLSEELLDKIRIWGNGHRRPPQNDDGVEPQAAPELQIDWSRYGVCIIGASTGGPAAIERILGSARPGLPVPVVVIQHMPEGFTRPFAERLDTLCALDVAEATHGAELAPGRVLVARSGRHLKIDIDRTVRLARQPSDMVHRPSIDVTMYSAASALPDGHVVGILLTGMGDDGAEGMYAIRSRSGLTVAEHADSCVVPGMPVTACKRGGVQYVLPLSAIAGLFA